MVKSGEISLIGQYKVKITSKGRIAFPKKLRSVLGNKIIITRGYDGCLIVISPREWSKLIAGIEQKPFIFEATRETTRFLLGNAASIDLDSQGRFIIPFYLKEYAQINKEVVFLGLGKYIEIWDKVRWENYQNYLGKNIKHISERLNDERS